MKFFSDDLPEAVRMNSRQFQEIQDNFKPIPLPASDTAAAKKARIAACLVTLGSRLVERIFVPYYTLPDENADMDLPNEIDDIAMMLSSLSRVDAKKELYLRSCILAIEPEQQKQVAYERGAVIAEEVCLHLSPLITPSRHTDFKTEVQAFCTFAVDTWLSLRTLKQKIEPFTIADDTGQYWVPVEFDLSTRPVSPSPSQHSQISANSTAHPEGGALVTKTSNHSLRSSKTVGFIWPGFSLGNHPLKRGYMLLESQVRVAGEEMYAKRQQRAMQRACKGVNHQQRRPGSVELKLFPWSTA
ncbi:hypothetical protein GGR57DRAFT_470851 [Xylariaceae sp. FL1272]|nr:hypothetical protein GGR57DRAFT_470851 [Xylariaceae sp. FL1272]